jgi:hypothetical protein
VAYYKCYQCDWEWISRGKREPRRCPDCETTAYNRPYEKPPVNAERRAKWLAEQERKDAPAAAPNPTDQLAASAA